jgi:tetratricopeptide (TPR) repeat protein
VDLRSSNGVRVNGEEYRSVHLKRGDVIELGHVRFRYVEPGEVFHFVPDRNTYSEPAPAGSTGGGGGLGKMMAVAAVLGVFLVVVGVIGFLVVSSGDGDKTPEASKTPEVTENLPPAVPEDASVKAYLQDADKAIAEEKWQIAVALLERAKERDPSNSSILDKLSQAQREKPLKEHYTKGQKALEQGDYQTALDEFAKLPGDTNLSIYSNRVKNQGLREQAEQGLVDNFLDEAREAQRQKKWFEVRRAADKALEIDEENDEAQRLSRLASRELREDGRDRQASRSEARNNQNSGRDTPAGKQTPKENPTANNGGSKEPAAVKAALSPEEIKSRRNELLGRAAASNRSGNFGEAISLSQEALRCCKGGKRAIYQIALAYQRQGNNAQAIKWYNKWLAGNPSSRLADNVRDTIRKLGGTPIN